MQTNTRFVCIQRYKVLSYYFLSVDHLDTLRQFVNMVYVDATTIEVVNT